MPRELIFEGVVLTVNDSPFAPIGNSKAGEQNPPGTIYVAKRNTGWKLLTVKEDDVENGWVIPEEMEYAYDRYECFKVLSMGDD